MTDQNKKKKPYVFPYNGEDIKECSGPNCGAEIWWTTTQRGKPCPVTKSTGHAHFIDCPNADDFRRAKRRKA